ncbi:MAG: cupredoxin domain-containing protein [Chloroflexi bacterium]|nr:cupredoxin domain-containing protein [Chloroflexota bacterium]
MEYVQTVLVKVAATKFEAALQPGGLISDLEAHRDFVAGQPGARGMQMTRSLSPEGDALVVVETRWANNNARADYASGSTNAASIINAHQSEIVAGSLDVHRMQADRAPGQEAPTRMYDRMALALLVPAGVLSFALLVIYGISRIYLTLPAGWATPVAAAMAVTILGLCWYFATHPTVPRWQYAAVLVVGLGALAAGGTATGIYDYNNSEVKRVETPPPPPPPGTTPSAPGTPVIDMGDLFFADAQGNKAPTITIAAGQPVTIDIRNTGAALHNVHVSSADGSYPVAFCKVGGENPCSDPAQISGGASGKLVVNLPPGTYNFRCDFHPSQMTGKLVVQ